MEPLVAMSELLTGLSLSSDWKVENYSSSSLKKLFCEIFLSQHG